MLALASFASCLVPGTRYYYPSSEDESDQIFYDKKFGDYHFQYGGHGDLKDPTEGAHSRFFSMKFAKQQQPEENCFYDGRPRFPGHYVNGEDDWVDAYWQKYQKQIDEDHKDDEVIYDKQLEKDAHFQYRGHDDPEGTHSRSFSLKFAKQQQEENKNEKFHYDKQIGGCHIKLSGQGDLRYLRQDPRGRSFAMKFAKEQEENCFYDGRPRFPGHYVNGEDDWVDAYWQKYQKQIDEDHKDDEVIYDKQLEKDAHFQYRGHDDPEGTHSRSFSLKFAKQQPEENCFYDGRPRLPGRYVNSGWNWDDDAYWQRFQKQIDEDHKKDEVIYDKQLEKDAHFQYRGHDDPEGTHSRSFSLKFAKQQQEENCFYDGRPRLPGRYVNSGWDWDDSYWQKFQKEIDEDHKKDEVIYEKQLEKDAHFRYAGHDGPAGSRTRSFSIQLGK